MASLLRTLWTTAKEWRQERRDLRCLKAFLQSPSFDERQKVLKKASNHAGLLMMYLWEFVRSGLETLEIRTNGDFTWTTIPGDLPAPGSLFGRIEALIQSSYSMNTGPQFSFVCEGHAVQIVCALPDHLHMDIETGLLQTVDDSITAADRTISGNPDPDLEKSINARRQEMIQKIAAMPGPCITLTKLPDPKDHPSAG
jgi:hypothetical protein